MKILAISGSNRDKTTNYMLRKVMDFLDGECEKELVFLKDKKIGSCHNCKGCHRTFACVQKDDVGEILEKMKQVEVLLLGSPTYFDNVSGIMKNFMDRCLPLYFSGEMKGRRVALVSVGGYPELIERDEKGNCLWCQEDNECQMTVNRCLDAMENFCRLIGMEVIGKVAAVHGAPEEKNQELEKLAKIISGQDALQNTV